MVNKCKKGYSKKGNQCVIRKGRVTTKKVGGGYDVAISGDAVEFAKTKGEAQMKANRIRDMQGKYTNLNRMTKSEKVLKRNVARRKGKYATARDQELMFGY